jgi:exodeoxyribonuclease-3
MKTAHHSFRTSTGGRRGSSTAQLKWLLALSWLALPAIAAEPITVLNYNVFNGFRGGRSYKPTVAWVNTVKPDIAAWQELVGWNEARLKKAATDWHHPHAAALKDGGYNIGITSRKPIEVMARNTKGFHHGYLHCRTAGIDVIVCHLWPAGVRQQLGEADQLRDLVRRLAKEGRQVILMGDFNAHAATDKPWLDKQQPLLDRRIGGNAKKHPEDRFIVAGKYIFPIMNRILEAPLHDVVHEKFAVAHPAPTYAEGLRLGSFPTRVLGHVKTPKLQRGFLERIDFILTTPALAKRCISAKVCREPSLLETTSDHYPVLAVFKPNGHAEPRGRGEKK